MTQCASATICHTHPAPLPATGQGLCMLATRWCQQIEAEKQLVNPSKWLSRSSLYIRSEMTALTATTLRGGVYSLKKVS
jgi:hypothetical protein